MNSITLKRSLAAIALVGALSFGGLTACSAQDAAEDAVENAIEEAAGEDVDVDVADESGEASLPSDFPSDVPTLDGKLTAALASSGSYTLTYELDGADDLTAFADSLDGWTQDSSMEAEGTLIYAYSNGEWSLSLSGAEESGVYSALYILTPVQG